MRRRFQEDRIAFKLYEMIQTARKIETATLTTNFQYLEETIELIKSIIVGNSALEGELAEIVMNDLDALTKNRDMDFVNKVFIPLIKLEKTLPITLA